MTNSEGKYCWGKEKEEKLRVIRDLCGWICYHSLAYLNDDNPKRLNSIENELKNIQSLIIEIREGNFENEKV